MRGNWVKIRQILADTSHSQFGFEQSLTAWKGESIVGLPRGWAGGEIVNQEAPWVRHEPAE
jgi:hypothetical protein